MIIRVHIQVHPKTSNTLITSDLLIMVFALSRFLHLRQ